jgi:hypothetical protein
MSTTRSITEMLKPAILTTTHLIYAAETDYFWTQYIPNMLKLTILTTIHSRSAEADNFDHIHMLKLTIWTQYIPDML